MQPSAAVRAVRCQQQAAECKVEAMKTQLWRRYLTFWRPDVRKDVDDELRFHLDERTADLIAEGLTPSEAAHRARAEFGDVDQAVSYTHLRAHETPEHLVCRLLLEK